jgi:hypothetical protein
MRRFKGTYHGVERWFTIVRLTKADLSYSCYYYEEAVVELRLAVSWEFQSFLR